MEINFAGKTVVITGGSTGIGATTVKTFLESEAKVVFTGIEDESLVDFAQYEDFKGKVFYKRLDVTDEDAVAKFADYVKKEHGGCDILYNNAGILTHNLLHETPTEEWKRTMDVNVNGVFFSSKYFIPHMLEKGEGAIVNTCSISGEFADFTFCAYNASKGAVANMTRNMALDYAQYNIRVNAVAPGSVRTSMYNNFAEGMGQEILDIGTNKAYPMGRIAEPQDVANAVVFLASDKASYITGAHLFVDGGITAWSGAQHLWDDVKIIVENNKK